MGGFSNVSGSDSIVFANNASFDGTERGGGLSSDGQLWIGSSTDPHVRVGRLISSDNSLLINSQDGNINLRMGSTSSSPSAIYASDSPSIDAFGRWRSSMPITLFDAKNIYNDPNLADSVENQPIFFDNAQISGAGTSTAYMPGLAAQRLSVSASTAGVRARQSLQRFNYQSGKSQLILITFNFYGISTGISKKAGYFDANNGIFLDLNNTAAYICLRTSSSGSPVTASVIQADWNIDRMDGNGPSGISINFSKTQILFIDFEWLGVGRVRVGFVIDGKIYYVHEFLNANVQTLVYMSMPNLPIRYEIQNFGAGAASYIDSICSTVISEGGSESLGDVRRASTSTALSATATATWYALVGLKLNSSYIGSSIKVLSLQVSEVAGNKDIEFALFYNPTVAGAFTYTNLSQSCIDVAYGATANTVSGGYMIEGGFFSSTTGGNGLGSISQINSVLSLGTSISGTSTSMVLCCRLINGTTSGTVYGGITWKEAI